MVVWVRRFGFGGLGSAVWVLGWVWAYDELRSAPFAHVPSSQREGTGYRVQHVPSSQRGTAHSSRRSLIPKGPRTPSHSTPQPTPQPCVRPLPGGFSLPHLPTTSASSSKPMPSTLTPSSSMATRRPCVLSRHPRSRSSTTRRGVREAVRQSSHSTTSSAACGTMRPHTSTR